MITKTEIQYDDVIHLVLQTQKTNERQKTENSSTQEETYLSKMQALARILSEYKKEEDDLSQQLFKWGVDFLNLTFTPIQPSEDAVIQRIDHLQEILIEPFSGVLLKDPWLVPKTHLTWEKEILDDYLESHSQIGLDLSEMTKISHFFAKAMLQWLNFSSNPEQSTSLILEKQMPQNHPPSFAITPLNPTLKVIEYTKKIEQVFAERKQQAQKNFLTQQLQILNQKVEERKKYNAEKLKEVKLFFEEKTSEVSNRLNHVREEYQENLNVLQETQKSTKEKLENTKKKVKEIEEQLLTAQSKISSQSNTIQSLSHQVHCLQNQVSWMSSNPPKNSRSRCTIL